MTAAGPVVIELLGWAATAVFVGSYFFKRAEVLVRVQMAGAVMWVAYGLLMGAPPVVVANVLVLGAAAWKAWQAQRLAVVVEAGPVQGPRAAGAAAAPGRKRPGVLPLP